MSNIFNIFPPHFISSVGGISWDEDEDIDEDEDEPITERSKETHPLAKKMIMPDGSEAMRCVDCLNDFIGVNGNQQNGSFICTNCKYWSGK